ncbi:hypothetical protein [Sporomusa sp.]|uniref:hypothetical protein n=1 Tax=Sporomusa sp. TaxID=2078658 RepID=UPI002CA1C5E9|nr:hypothetical protein [Sporomusa sp.]HWR45344.1 hypothetical protein [Sporomusa sp.]
MNLRHKKIVVAITGAAIISGGFAPILFPHAMAAIKWVDNKPAQTQPNIAAIEEKAVSEAEVINKQVKEEIINTEAVITENNGTMQRVVIDNTGKQTVSVTLEKVIVEQLQQEADKGNQQWLLDPVSVVKSNAGKYGFDVKKDSFTLISQVYNSSTTGTGKAYVLVGHGAVFYLVELVQPTGSGNSKIWQIVSIKEAKVTQPQKPDKPDVGPGVEGLDYDRAIKWQQAVDAGREMWRLDPMLVAKNEGKTYGFSEKDQFTIIRKLSSSSISRHGQIDVEVIHDDKKYTMILVKPFGGRDAIWTTYKVTGTVIKPGTPIGEKVIYSTDKYKNWQWNLPQYPQGTGVAAIYSYELQAKRMNLQQVPQPVIDKLQDVDLTNKVALVAYLGGTSSSNMIGIEKVTLKDKDLTVKVRTKSPHVDAPMTKDYVYPSDYVLIERSLFETTGSINVTFVDQSGKVLGQMKLSL